MKDKKENKRHGEFQFGTNPMQMSEFEKRMAFDEKHERQMATETYIKGIHGRDGGCLHPEKEERY